MTLSGALPVAAPVPGRRDSVLPPHLVLLAAGTPAAVAATIREAAPLLAPVLGLELAAELAVEDPPAVLAALQNLASVEAAAAGPRLVPLPIDPGVTLADGSCWAEALGAWRQPALLLLGAEQQQSGLAAAMTALLRQADVPLAGLVQWGLPWSRELRRRDGLPWLGALDAQDPNPALSLALRLGCAQLRARGWEGGA